MSPQQLINECHQHGVSVSPMQNGQLWIEPIASVPDSLLRLLRQHKPELIKHLRPHIPCQVQWLPDCAGSDAPTTLIEPKRFGFKARKDQVAAACDSCREIMEYRGKDLTFDRENYLLWGVFRTQQLMNGGVPT